MAEMDAGGGDVGREMEKSAEVTGAFSDELGKMQRNMWLAGREVDRFAKGIGSGLQKAFDGVVFDGVKLSDALKGVARSMSDTAYDIAMKPVRDAVSGALARGINGAVSPFAQGAAFSAGRVTAFAKGGVVSQPVRFPMRGGTGLMGEAGPEAIMPLSRGPDGRLGVAAAGGSARPVNVSITVNTPDVAGFARSQSQIAAQMGRLLARGERNM